MFDKGLEDDIHECKKCLGLSGSRQVFLSGKKIPSDFGEKPNHIRILFVAESPAARGVYFYDQNTKSNLKDKLLNLLLDAGLLQENSIDEFRRRQYYLADTVKCPFRKPNENNAHPPDQVVENCRRFLMQEVSNLNPKVICTLGKTSLKPFIRPHSRFNLKMYLEKDPLPKTDLRDDSTFTDTPIVASWFPSAMTNWSNKVEVLRRLRKYVED